MTDFYTGRLDITKAKQLMDKDTQTIYDIADRVALNVNLSTDDYLKKVAQTAYLYARSDDFHDRERLCGALNSVCEKEGMFVCLLGGKNSGKSTLLKRLAKSKDKRVLYVDLRRSATIVNGLIAALEAATDSAVVYAVKRLLAKTVIKPTDVFDSESFAEFSLKRIINTNKEEESEVERLVQLICAIVDVLGPITIVIDEANIAFALDEETPQIGRLQSMKDTLRSFTSLTKQDLKVTTNCC
jgi:hypothetical protein